MSQKSVGDLMHKGVIACGPSTPMNEVVRIISDTSVHAVVVMDDENRPLSWVSHMDIIRLFGEDLTQYRASDVMRDAVILIETDQPAKAGAELMRAHDTDRLLVIEVEGGTQTPVGVLSTTDLVKEMRGARWIWHMG